MTLDPQQFAFDGSAGALAGPVSLFAIPSARRQGCQGS
jgi:hypothetical protein